MKEHSQSPTQEEHDDKEQSDEDEQSGTNVEELTDNETESVNTEESIVGHIKSKFRSFGSNISEKVKFTTPKSKKGKKEPQMDQKSKHQSFLAK